MVSIAAFADAEQRDRIRHPAVRLFLQQYHASTLADGNTVAIRVEGAASDRGEQAERVEPIQRGEAETVDAADHRRIAQAGRNHARGTAECLCARRTRGGYRHRRSGQAEIRLHEPGNRVGVVRRGIAKVRRQRAAGVAPAVRQFRLEYPRGAGADEYADAGRAVLLPCRHYRLVKSILLQAQLRDAVVAAVEFGQIGAHRRQHGIGYLANEGVEPDCLECARGKPGAHFAQCLRGGVEPDPGAAGNGAAIEKKRLHSMISRSIRTRQIRPAGPASRPPRLRGARHRRQPAFVPAIAAADREERL